MKTTLSWKNQMQFVSNTRGHESLLDAGYENGGLNRGANPKEFVLQGLAGCSAMDAIFYLTKHKQVPLTFDISVDADMTEKITPVHFKEIRVLYKFVGDTLDKEKVITSVQSSMTKYCGVSYMLSKACPIKFQIELNGELVFSGDSQFN